MRILVHKKFEEFLREYKKEEVEEISNFIDSLYKKKDEKDKLDIIDVLDMGYFLRKNEEKTEDGGETYMLIYEGIRKYKFIFTYNEDKDLLFLLIF